MDERMEHDPGSVGVDEILAARDAVSMLVAVSEEQQQCFEVLPVEETEALDFSGVRGSVTMLLSMTSSVNRRADRLEKRVTDLRQRFEMHQQDTTNRNLAVLTIISAIFLPLSLLAGIWGMKFESMPELHFSMGYPLALGLMVLIAVVLTWFFYWRGCFG